MLTFLALGCAAQATDPSEGESGGSSLLGGGAGSGGIAQTAGHASGGAMAVVATAGGQAGPGAGGSGGVTATMGGASGAFGGSPTAAGSGGAGGAPMVSVGAGTTPDLIGPGGPTCGNPNATHDDGWICLLSAPAMGSNVVGAWFDYAWPAAASCAHQLKKPSGAARQICFSGGSCASAAAGAGVGFSVCDVHGVNVSTWPEMQQLITSHGLSSTGKSPFSACNTGAKMTQISWTASGAGTPAGMSVVLQDAADTSLGRIDNLPAGATTAMVPATIDTTKVASVHFQFGGAVKSWDFCLSKLQIAYQ